MEEAELNALKEEISKKIKYPDGSEEQKQYEIQKAIIESTPNEGSHGYDNSIDSYQKQMNTLEETAILAIKKKNGEDENVEFYKKIEAALPTIKEIIKSKNIELHELFEKYPTNPNFGQRIYSKITHRPNQADIALTNHDTRKNDLSSEISSLEQLRNDIETLLPIYKPTTDGGRRKTVRKRKSKRRKSRKSNRRR